MDADLRLLRLRQLDEALRPWAQLRDLRTPPSGRLAVIREALGMTLEQLGRRIGIDAAGAKKLQDREATGSITLHTLRRAADAMDCDLVYAIVPRTSLQETLDRRARDLARAMLNRVGQTMDLEAQGVPDDPDQSAEQVTRLAKGLLDGRLALLWDDPVPNARANTAGSSENPNS